MLLMQSRLQISLAVHSILESANVFDWCFESGGSYAQVSA